MFCTLFSHGKYVLLWEPVQKKGTPIFTAILFSTAVNTAVSLMLIHAMLKFDVCIDIPVQLPNTTKSASWTGFNQSFCIWWCCEIVNFMPFQYSPLAFFKDEYICILNVTIFCILTNNHVFLLLKCYARWSISKILYECGKFFDIVPVLNTCTSAKCGNLGTFPRRLIWRKWNADVTAFRLVTIDSECLWTVKYTCRQTYYVIRFIYM